MTDVDSNLSEALAALIKKKKLDKKIEIVLYEIANEDNTSGDITEYIRKGMDKIYKSLMIPKKYLK